MKSQADQLLERPIILVGAPRSGTTILATLLSSHPTVVQVQEPRLTWRYGNDRKSDMLTTADARPEVCQHIRSVFSKTVRKSTASRLIEKTPSNSLRLGFVDRVLPNCLFVHILRDGVESTLSINRFWRQHSTGLPAQKVLQRLREINLRQLPYYGREFIRRVLPRRFARVAGRPVWGPRIPGIDGLLKDLHLLEVCALQWKMCVEAACSFGRSLPSDRYLECRLEELNPTTLKQILDFCQLDDSREIWQTFDREFDASLTRHRRANAATEEIELIRPWIESTMERLGYSFDGGCLSRDPSRLHSKVAESLHREMQPAFA